MIPGFALGACAFAVATANVAAMPLATQVGSTDVGAAYPGAKLVGLLSLVSFRWFSSLVRGLGLRLGSCARLRRWLGRVSVKSLTRILTLEFI